MHLRVIRKRILHNINFVFEFFNNWAKKERLEEIIFFFKKENRLK